MATRRAERAANEVAQRRRDKCRTLLIISCVLAVNNLEQFRVDYERARVLGVAAGDLRHAIESSKSAGQEGIREETLTKLELCLV
jgi:hypothetical protein